MQAITTSRNHTSHRIQSSSPVILAPVVRYPWLLKHLLYPHVVRSERVLENVTQALDGSLDPDPKSVAVGSHPQESPYEGWKHAIGIHCVVSLERQRVAPMLLEVAFAVPTYHSVIKGIKPKSITGQMT